MSLKLSVTKKILIVFLWSKCSSFEGTSLSTGGSRWTPSGSGTGDGLPDAAEDANYLIRESTPVPGRNHPRTTKQSEDATPMRSSTSGFATVDGGVERGGRHWDALRYHTNWKRITGNGSGEIVNLAKRGFVRGGGNRMETGCGAPGPTRGVRLLNATKTAANGKTVLITKLLKTRKCRKTIPTIQRRTSDAPSPSVDFRVPWMTRKDEGTEDGSDPDGGNPYATPEFPQGGKIMNDPHGQVADPPKGNVNKFNNALSLFTIIKFDNGECYLNGLTGNCLHSIECTAKGGKSIGSCAEGYGTCCYVERTCGERTGENGTYFVNEGFPKPSTDAPKICTVTVEKSHPEVQQLRIEFVIFELRGPNNGTCISDRLTITGQNGNDIIPDICGINSQHHVYVDIDDSKGPYNLNIITMGNEFPRTFQIKIIQLGKNDELRAPKNCLQYFRGVTGVIQSFNYQFNNLGNLPQARPGYFNNLNYAICLKKVEGYCSVTYENYEGGEIDDNPAFQLLNVNEDGITLLPPNQGGAETFDCPDDYLIINGMRLCGEKLNDAAFDADYTRNYPVTEFSNGPFMLQVRTNDAVNGRGFYLKYRQNPCLQ